MDWLVISGIIIASYLGICLLAYLLQEFFLFHPEKLNLNFKFKYDIPFEEILLAGEEGSVIDGLLFPVEGAERVVFYFKGNTRSIKGWSKFAKDFTTKGYNFFLIDYPGFGKSTGKRSEELIYKNAQIAYDWLKTRFEENRIIIYGRSLGAGFATHIAARNNPLMIILDCPFYDFQELARYYTRILPTGYLLDYKMPLYKDVMEIKTPIFILHGSRDWIIPYRYSRKIENIDPSRIKLFTIEGASHNNLPQQEQYQEHLNTILNDRELLKTYSQG